jgi:hypothetical protein
LIRSERVPAKLYQGLTKTTIPLGAARTLVGAAVLARPALLAGGMGVDAATVARTAWIARFFASRDLALGIGSVSGSRACQAAACLSDISDFVALFAALRARQVKPLPAAFGLATAAGAAVVGGAGLLITRR